MIETPQEIADRLLREFFSLIRGLAMFAKPWNKPHPMARKCHYCKSQKPGMQPLRLIVRGKVIRGYWHLKCFAKEKKANED